MNLQEVDTKTSNKEVLEKLYRKQLSKQELFEAKTNLMGFFETLMKVDKRMRIKKKLEKQM